MHKRFWFFSIGFLALLSCTKEVIDAVAFFRQPANFPAPVYKLENNTVTKEGFELGRKLFYEPRLSRDNTVSCGSCHIQAAAFTHHGHDISHGIYDRLGNRNSPAIMNLAWNTSFMWDGGIFDLDLQPIAPITNHEEMDETVENVITKLKAHADYPGLFKKAFGTEDITTARMMKALSQFMLMCISSNSKYDKVMRREGAVFTTDEQQGYELFVQKCGTCHKEPLFTDNSFRNNGIEIGLNNDKGRYAVTLNQADQYKFKVPSLRNVELTAPYMHDGRFYTLDAVIDHYRSNVQTTPNLDPLLNNGALGIAITDSEKIKLIAFLKTLTDREFINNKQFAEQ
jgi:cytochrome c peroxidase